MSIINNRGGVRLFLNDAISYTMRKGGSRGKALLYFIFGKQLSIEKAQQFIEKNGSYPLSGRISTKIKERETTSTHAPSVMQNPSSTHQLSPKKTNQPHTAYQPNSNDSALFDLIIDAFTHHKRPISELEGLTSHQVVDKLQTMGIINQQDMIMIGYNKNSTDFGRVVDYAM
ncbi:hypothetical protein GCM10023116_18960 [Kistimonas scapharcae]|uniref:Uncharacterized protein n=1 Tax=Kistimonas scapharcae TaxID=1036133 RepID=A0ABP8V1H5_9GAMM